MPTPNLTDHAVQRFAQRGFRIDDVEIIMELGTEVKDGFLVLEKDIQAFDRALKSFRDRVLRLRGARLIVAEGAVITGYHADKRKQKALLHSN
jgi:hypothetical protein